MAASQMSSGPAAGRRFTSRAGVGAALMWAFAFAWCGVTVAAFLVVYGRGALNAGLWAFFAVFTLAGLYLLHRHRERRVVDDHHAGNAASLTIITLRTKAEAEWIAFELRRALALRPAARYS